MAHIGSKKVKTVVVIDEDGKEQVVDFDSRGLGRVSRFVKKKLLKMSPDIYFDPDSPNSGMINFADDIEALQYYINKLKTVGNATRLCSVLKAEYENVQGDLLSGRYSEKNNEEKVMKKVKKHQVEEEEETSDDDIDELVGAGDSIRTKKKSKRE